MISSLSDISRTNQLKIISLLEEIAEKLHQYLFNNGKGIESFPAYSKQNMEEEQPNDDDDLEDEHLNRFIEWHREIKQKIRERLAMQGEDLKEAYPPQYVMAKVDEKWQVFYLSPNKKYAGWKDAFIDPKNANYRQTILNLIFKAYLLSKLPRDFMSNEYMDKLLLIHSINPAKIGDGLEVWGQTLFLNYNRHHVITLTLSRKNLLFSKKDPYRMFDGDDVRLLKYYDYSKKLDARRENEISFMIFPPRKDKEPFETFKKTQLYYYQYLMTQLEEFLQACKITYEPLDFQADHYLQDRFIKHLPPVGALEIINNSGTDLTDTDKQALEHIFYDFGSVSVLTFYDDGKSISTYEQIKLEEKTCWKITQAITWTGINLDTDKNYLVFNKILNNQTEQSTAHQKEDGYYYPAKKIDNKPSVDFYSQLKRTYNYLNREKFFSTQGVDIAEVKIISHNKNTRSVLKRPKTIKETKKSNETRKAFRINDDVLLQDTEAFTDGKLLLADQQIIAYLAGQQDKEERKKFYEKYAFKLSPEFQKIFIELSIKNWVRSAVLDQSVSFPIPFKELPEQKFFAIYVRNPKKPAKKSQKPTEKIIAVEFLYKEGNLSITRVLYNLIAKDRFRSVLKTKKATPEELLNGRHYLVDEKQNVCISCYTDNFFTPTLIGAKTILQKLKDGTLQINRNMYNLLPLVLHYKTGDKRKKRELRNMICLDLHNKQEKFMQYYIPLAGNPKALLKDAEGFRIYHIIGQTFSGRALTTDELSEHPLTELHFSTLTQNILKISDNSQSSLFQKIAKVFIEN